MELQHIALLQMLQTPRNSYQVATPRESTSLRIECSRTQQLYCADVPQESCAPGEHRDNNTKTNISLVCDKVPTPRERFFEELFLYTPPPTRVARPHLVDANTRDQLFLCTPPPQRLVRSGDGANEVGDELQANGLAEEHHKEQIDIQKSSHANSQPRC